MAFTMNLNMKEVTDWVRNQPERDRAKKQSMIIIKNELVKEVIQEMSEHRTTGELEGSVMGVATDNKVEIRSNSYGDIVLEYGRKPGRFPPVEPLERWAMLHGMDKGTGYLIARKIAREGTEKYKRGGEKQITKIEERLNKDLMPSRIEYLLDAYTK